MMNSRTSQQTLTLTYADGVMLGGNDTAHPTICNKRVCGVYGSASGMENIRVDVDK